MRYLVTLMFLLIQLNNCKAKSGIFISGFFYKFAIKDGNNWNMGIKYNELVFYVVEII